MPVVYSGKKSSRYYSQNICMERKKWQLLLLLNAKERHRTSHCIRTYTKENAINFHFPEGRHIKPE